MRSLGKFARAFTALGALLGASHAAEAAVVTWRADGTITTIGDSAGYMATNFGAIAAGDPFSMTFAFESTAPDLAPATNQGGYGAIQAITATVGTTTVIFATRPPTLSSILLFNDVEQFPGQFQDTYLARSAATALVGGNFQVQLGLATAIDSLLSNALTSDALPNVPFPLDDFTMQRELVVFLLGNSSQIVRAHVDTLAVVPLPAGLPLLLGGDWRTRIAGPPEPVTE